jgi:hypothetical protein
VPEGGPEDRFGDLGAPDAQEEGRRRREAIGDKLAEQDRINPEPMPKRPEVPRPGNKYAWVVGVVMLMGIGVLLLTTALPNTGEGVRGPTHGERLRVFAAPLATGNIEGDANVRQGRGGSDAAGAVPACQVRSKEVVNLCELRKKPMVLTFLVTRGADCEPQVDRVERMRRDFPEVNFAAVMSGNERADAEEIVRNRRWTQPVAVDHDGAVVNLYGIGVCPTTVFARSGGIVVNTALGNLTEDQLRARVRRLLRAERKAR